jgi:hypothetical protein
MDTPSAVAVCAKIPTSDRALEVALDHDRNIVRSRLLVDHRIAVDQLGYSPPTNLNAVSGLEKVRD